MNILKSLYHLPQYLFWQITLRLPGENTERYNKWQPTIKQSLSEYIEYESQFAPNPFKKGSRLIWGIILSIVALILTSTL